MSRNFTSVLFGLIGAAALSTVAVAAGPDLGPVQMQSLNWAAIGIFALFVLGTLGITYRAAMQTKTAADFYAAGGALPGFRMVWRSPATTCRLPRFSESPPSCSPRGFDGLIYSIGFLVGWPVVLFLIAERLRNLGSFTFADVASFRLDQTPIASCRRPVHWSSLRSI